MRAAILLLLAAGGAHAVGFRAIVSPLTTQADAKASCVAQGGTLAKVATLADLALVQQLSCNPLEVWVGAEDSAQEGEWVWQDGSALSDADAIWSDDATPWRTAAQDCAVGAPDGAGWKIFAHDCVCCDDEPHLLPFVCQIGSLETNEMVRCPHREPCTLNPKSETLNPKP